MARKRAVKTDGKIEEGKGQADTVIVQGIWGLIYLSIGVLLLISMIFYSHKQLAEGATHVLGPYLGTGMAMGLFYIFGWAPAAAFAAAVCYIGAAKLVNRQLRLKLLLFLAVLMFQLCLLLAVKHMPEINANGLNATADAAGSNYIGLRVINALSPLFGGRVFGPYFIVSLLMTITVMVGLRVRPKSAIDTVSKWLVTAALWIKRAFVEVKTGIENSPDILPAAADQPAGADNAGMLEDKQRKSKEPPKKKEKNGRITSKQETLPAAAEPPVQNIDDIPFDINKNENDDNGDINDDNNNNPNDDAGTPDKELTYEEEAQISRNKEYAEFEKKRKEPIQILTVETPDIEADDDEALIPIFETETPDYDIIEDIAADAGEEAEGANGADGEVFTVRELPKPEKPYIVPPPGVIQDPPPLSNMIDEETIRRTSAVLEKTLMHFKVEGKVVAVSPGPVVTRYEIVLAPGIKVSKVTSLQDDLLMAVSAEAIRIQAPIPGKSAVGIELPNETRQNVHFKHILLSNEFKKNYSLPVIIGSNISGIPYVTDITKTPHLLIAGQTGSGKSVCMNALICSLLMTKKPEELRLIMIDPKQVEFASFENIPHLLAPVVTESKEAVKALQWGVIEMERRYKLLTSAGVRKIDDFNTKLASGKLAGILPEEESKPLPLIVIIIDELADLMMTAPKDVEGLIARITQKARAAGIHMIVATQRPSVNVITGLIKANLPSRIAFRTVSSVDSRTILDQGGSEKLLGMGDMLFLRNGAQNVERFHGAFIPDEDVEAIVAAIKEQQVDIERIDSFHSVVEDPDDDGGDDPASGASGARDPLFAEAARVTVSLGQGSTSLLQRRMNIGFARAGRIMDQLERAGIVGPSKGSKTREVLVGPEELDYLLKTSV